MNVRRSLVLLCLLAGACKSADKKAPDKVKADDNAKAKTKTNDKASTDKPVKPEAPIAKKVDGACVVPSKLEPIADFELPGPFERFSMDGTKIRVGSEEKVVIADAATGKLLSNTPLALDAFAWSFDGGIQLVPTKAGGTERVDIAAGTHTAIPSTLITDPQGTLSDDGAIFVFDFGIVDVVHMKSLGNISPPWAGGATGSVTFIGDRIFIDANGRAAAVIQVPTAPATTDIEGAIVPTNAPVTADGKHFLEVPYAPWAMDYDDTFAACTMGVDPCVTIPIKVPEGTPVRADICATGALVATSTTAPEITFYSIEGGVAKKGLVYKVAAPFDRYAFTPDGGSLAIVTKNHLSLFRLAQ